MCCHGNNGAVCLLTSALAVPLPPLMRSLPTEVNMPEIDLLGHDGKFTSRKGEKKTFTVPVAIRYPYGLDDVSIAIKADHDDISDIKLVGDSKSVMRVLSFTHQADNDYMEYKIALTSASKAQDRSKVTIARRARG